MDIALVASVGENFELGRAGDLCWHIREDLRHFKQLTMGHPVVMGRKTWESLPRRPLPGRLNVVVTSRPETLDLSDCPDTIAVSSLSRLTCPTPMIIGGASLYAAAMPMADRLEITRIFASDPKADTFFPRFSEQEWRLANASDIMTSEGGIRFRYETWLRK